MVRNKVMDIGFPSYFRLAKNVSKYSDFRVRVGAVIIYKSKVISVGYNKNKSHPRFNTLLKQTMHAEASAILASGKNSIKGCEIFVYRENKKGEPALSRPCNDCIRLLKEFGAKRMWYTTNEYPYFEIEEI